MEIALDKSITLHTMANSNMRVDNKEGIALARKVEKKGLSMNSNINEL